MVNVMILRSVVIVVQNPAKPNAAETSVAMKVKSVLMILVGMLPRLVITGQ